MSDARWGDPREFNTRDPDSEWPSVYDSRERDEHDLDLPHDTLESLHEQRLVELVDLGDSERGLTLTTEGRHLLDSHSLQAAAAGVVLSGGDRVRRKSIQSNRRNGTTFQLLGAVREC